MTKPVMNYHSLLGLLQTFEKDYQLQKELVNLVEGLFTRRRSSKREKKKKVQKSHSADPKQSKMSKVDKSQEKYFFYKMGHWKRNYLSYIATLDPNRPKNKRKK